MRTLIVTSTKPYSGKSGLSLALLDLLADRGVAAGYFKPYGTMPVSVGELVTDRDAAYITTHATAKAPLDSVCPVVESRGLVEEILSQDPGGFEEKVRAAFTTASSQADVMVVEGPSDLAQARTLGLNLCTLAGMLDATTLLVDRPEGMDLPDAALWAADCLGDRMAGVVFNSVHESIHEFVSHDVSTFLERRGVHVFGSIGRDPMLSSVSVDEIVDSLGGTVLSAENHTEDFVESFMVGAMGQDKALRLFRRRARKAVITGGDRADVQLAALETDTRCIILTGNLPPSSLVLDRAEELGVPMVMVAMDTLSAVEKMEALLGRVRLHDPAKAARIREMFQAAVDVDELFAKVFGL